MEGEVKAIGENLETEYDADVDRMKADAAKLRAEQEKYQRDLAENAARVAEAKKKGE